MTEYNPLLDSFTAPVIPVAAERPWLAVCERVNDNIERAIRKGSRDEAFKWLNVMDLLCSETAAYWRETGGKVYAGVQGVEQGLGLDRSPVQPAVSRPISII